jgi:peptide/nickel transport system substrate-binding protein
VARALTPSARPESARADSGRAKTPRGGRFAAAAAAIVVSLLAVSGAGGAGAQTPKRGGTVVFATNEPNCLNEFFVAACAVTGAPDVSILVFKGAFKFAPDYTPRPDLVSNVEFTKTTPFTLTYHIRPEAHWSDGVEISANDFVFTHRAILKYIPAGSDEDDEDMAIHRTAVRSVRALDAKTVRVVLRTRVARWRSLLFDQVLPRHALLGEDLKSIWMDTIDNPKTGEPIGSGPFLFQRWQRGNQLSLGRNERYWGPHPAYLKQRIFRFDWLRGRPAEVLRKGDVDIYWSQVTRQEDYRRLPGYRRNVWPGGNLEHFQIRVGEGGHRALGGKQGKLVRRALAYGVDRVGLVRSFFGEIDPSLRPLDSMVFRTTSRFYEPNWSNYRYRPGEARRLLEQAGCRRGADRVYACGGEKLSLRFVTTAGAVRRELTIRLVQQQLRQVGVEVEPSYAPSAALFEQLLTGGKFDVALLSYFGPPDQPGLDVADVFRCGGPRNLTGYCQRLVARDLDQASRILDEERRARVLNRADAQLARDVPVIPLFQPPLAAYVRSNLHNSVDRSPVVAPWNAENWWLER